MFRIVISLMSPVEFALYSTGLKPLRPGPEGAGKEDDMKTIEVGTYNGYRHNAYDSLASSWGVIMGLGGSGNAFTQECEHEEFHKNCDHCRICRNWETGKNFDVEDMLKNLDIDQDDLDDLVQNGGVHRETWGTGSVDVTFVVGRKYRTVRFDGVGRPRIFQLNIPHEELPRSRFEAEQKIIAATTPYTPQQMIDLGKIDHGYADTYGIDEAERIQLLNQPSLREWNGRIYTYETQLGEPIQWRLLQPAPHMALGCTRHI
jgi:hypothetical protein